jgi:DNA-directed RNA polymerase subunit E'/Rpb7
MESFQITKTLSKSVTQMELEETDDVRQMIEETLKRDLEGIFIKEGYVIPDSLRVVDMSAGTVISESLAGDL